MKAARTLQRGLEVLEVLARADTPLGPTRVAELVGLDKATVARLLFTLCEAGYARPVPGGRYGLTPKVLALAMQTTVDTDLRARARPHLVALRDRTDETVHLGVRAAGQVVYIDKIEGTHPVRLVSAVGQTMPLHTTALGKAALAWMDPDAREELLSSLDLAPRTARSITDLATLRTELDRTRSRGYAIDDRENEDHASCVAAAIVEDGEVIGMVSVSVPSYRLADDADRLGSHCRDTAEAIAGSGARATTEVLHDLV